MSKTGKIILVFGILLMIVGTGVILLTIGKMSAENQKKAVTNNYDITEAVTDIDIKINTSNVEICDSVDGFKVECHESEKVTHHVEVKDGTLYITKVDETKWYESVFQFDFTKYYVKIYLPAGDYNNLIVDNSTGKFDARGAFSFQNATIKCSTGKVSLICKVYNDLKISISTGDVYLDSVNSKNIVVEGHTSDINLVEGNSENIEITTSTGDIHVKNVNSNVINVKADTGHVTLTNVIANDTFTIETSTGDVDFLGIDAGTFEITTSTGDVRGTMLTEKVFICSSTGRINVPESINGGKCKITTSTGNIIITIE